MGKGILVTETLLGVQEEEKKSGERGNIRKQMRRQREIPIYVCMYVSVNYHDEATSA